jgi:hypothetical protein
MLEEHRQWARRFDGCVNCGTTRRLHAAHGYCKQCYRLKRKIDEINAWDFNNSGSLGSFPKGIEISSHLIANWEQIKDKCKIQISQRLERVRFMERKLHSPISGMDLEVQLWRIARKLKYIKQTKIVHTLYFGVADVFDGNFDPDQRRLLYRLLYRMEEQSRTLGLTGMSSGKHRLKSTGFRGLNDGGPCATPRVLARATVSGVQLGLRRGISAGAAALLVLCAPLTSCMSVRQADLDTWVGQPVAVLEKHPVFLTMPVVRTVASDGTEIRNYVNGRNVGQCSGGGSIFGSSVDFATYSRFTQCMQSFAACNNIFYVKSGQITKYVPIGSGGARCYTDERTRPNFQAPTNF